MKDGGAAFPVFDSTSFEGLYACRYMGMTLRDWFAGQALAGFIKTEAKSKSEYAKLGYSWYGLIASECYQIADAMIAEGEKDEQNKNSACFHRKWPTPEQYREEYGREYPDDWAVYVWEYIPYPNNDYKYKWVVKDYLFAKTLPLKDKIIICACTPWGKPPDNWRPE